MARIVVAVKSARRIMGDNLLEELLRIQRSLGVMVTGKAARRGMI
jgi:hypothetical protein